MKSSNNVFAGDNAVLDYMNPDNNPPTPLVELPNSLNPYRERGVRIFAKLMHTLPLLNVKSIPAYSMLMEANKKGQLDKVNTIIENSSGNTVLSLSVIGNLIGIPNTKAFVSHEVTDGKLKLLQLFGVFPIVNKEPICPDPSDKSSGIYKSRIMAKDNGWFNAGQYDNQNNPLAHEKWTGKQIWEQTGGIINVFCSGLGTTGTMVGAGKFLKSQDRKIINVGVVRSPNNPVPGPRTENLLRQIAFKWRDVVDSLQSVGTVDSYKYSLELIRHGILAGPSSGFNLKGLIKYFDQLSEDNNLDQIRNINGEIIAVFLTCDTPLPYVDEYFKYLNQSNFPEVENKELLINTPQNQIASQKTRSLLNVDISKYEIDVTDAYDRIFKDGQNELWNKINNDIEIINKKDSVVIDIRNPDDFDHFHIPNAINLHEEYIENSLDYLTQQYDKKQVFVFCYRGNSSQRITALFRLKNINAYSVKGGMIDWSEHDYPRERPSVCKLRHS